MSAARVVGVDVARCLALVGMMATHILPGVVEGEVPVGHQVAAGRASALFALLAGMSLVLVAGTRSPVRGADLRGMVAGTAVRALLLALVGLLIGGLDADIAVILVYYAVLFVVAVPFLALGTRALVAVTVGWALAAPAVGFVLRDGIPPTSYAVPSFGSLHEPAALARDVVLTGYYPVLTWVPYVLAGIVVGRLDLRSRRAIARLAAFGAWAVVVAWSVSDALTAGADVRGELARSFEGAGWLGDLTTTLEHGLYGVVPTGSPWWLAVRAPHTGTTFDLLMTTGSACLVLAGCLALGRAWPGARIAFGAGAMTLSLYTLHVVLRTDGWWDGDDLVTFVGQATLVLAIGVVVRAAGGRGPLEVLVGEVSQGVRRAVTRPRIGSVP